MYTNLKVEWRRGMLFKTIAAKIGYYLRNCLAKFSIIQSKNYNVVALHFSDTRVVLSNVVQTKKCYIWLKISRLLVFYKKMS